jgi:topoisomerase-4 subunit B
VGAPRRRAGGCRRGTYDASSIEVLEGLEPVRKRPGMYIGGTDERALHHLVAEVLDNSMDEAVAGHASRIEVELHEDHSVTIRDNGRGIPVDPHPKFPDKIRAGGHPLHPARGRQVLGQGLPDLRRPARRRRLGRQRALRHLRVEVARNRELFVQEFSRGIPQGPPLRGSAVPNRRGTTVTFHADEQIFGSHRFKPARLFKMVRSKAYLFSGVEIRWKSAIDDGETPTEATFHFPGGLSDYLTETMGGAATYTDAPFAGKVEFQPKFGVPGSVEWAINWTPARDGFIQSYCNTVPTPEGGTHEAGFWAAILKGMRAYGELVGNKKAANITRDDLIGRRLRAGLLLHRGAGIRGPDQGPPRHDRGRPHGRGRRARPFRQLAGRRTPRPRARSSISSCCGPRNGCAGGQEKETRANPPRRSCACPASWWTAPQQARDGTELFIVEGDSAGGSAKMARGPQDPGAPAAAGQDPERAGRGVVQARPERRDLRPLPGAWRRHGHALQHRGSALRQGHHHDRRRCGRRAYRLAPDDVLLHPDAPPDRQGHLYLACPPLFRLTQGATRVYASTSSRRTA